MVTTDVNTVTYNGDGSTTAFPFTFKIQDASEINLQLVCDDDTVTDITSDFYVDTVNSTVYYPGYAPGAEPPEADQPPKVQTGQKLTIWRDVPMTQENDLGDKWPFHEIEDGLDKLTMIAQQIYSYTNRKLDAALASMFQLAGIVTDSGKLQHITDQYNAIDANAATATAKATAAANSATAAANSAASALSSKNTAVSTAAALTTFLETKETLTAPAVDATLTISGAAADAKVVGDSIDQLDNEVYGQPTVEEQTLVDGKYFSTTEVFRDGSTTYSKNGYNGAGALVGTSCFYKTVLAGEKYVALGVGSGTDSVGFFILTDSNRLIKASDKFGSRLQPIEIDVESDGYLYINFYGYNSATDYIKELIYPNTLREDVTEVSEKVDTLSEEANGTEVTETLTLIADKYFNTVPVFYDGDTTYDVSTPGTLVGTYCIKRVVFAGEKYVLNGNTNGTNAVGLYVYTDAEGNVISSQKVGLSTPTTVQISKDGYLYVNLRDYNSLTDYVQRKYYDGGAFDDVTALKESLPFLEEKVVNFGDSIFGNKRPPNDVSTALAKLLGATVYNGGFGGCRMAKHNLTNFDPFCMYRLAYSIVNQSWTLQDDAIANSSALPSSDPNKLPLYFPETLALLKSVDFSTVKSITIAYGTNDLTAEVVLDNPNNLYDTDCYGGALRYSLETLMSAFPQLQVFVCCPTYRFWQNDGVFVEDSDTYANGRGNTMADYIELLKNISKTYHVKFIDNYYELGIDKFNRTNWFPVGDGTHHNVKGARLIAEHMANVMF